MSEDKETVGNQPDSSAWVDKTTNDVSVWVADINVVNHDLGLRPVGDVLVGPSTPVEAESILAKCLRSQFCKYK